MCKRPIIMLSVFRDAEKSAQTGQHHLSGGGGGALRIKAPGGKPKNPGDCFVFESIYPRNRKSYRYWGGVSWEESSGDCGKIYLSMSNVCFWTMYNVSSLVELLRSRKRNHTYAKGPFPTVYTIHDARGFDCVLRVFFGIFCDQGVSAC